MIAQISEQIIRDSTSTTGLTIHETYLMVAVAALAGALIYMYFDNRGLHKDSQKQYIQLAEKMTVAMVNSTNAMEKNTEAVDRLVDKIDQIKVIQKKG